MEKRRPSVAALHDEGECAQSELLQSSDIQTTCWKMRRTQEHEEQREPAEGWDTAKRNIACASKCQRESVSGGKRKSGVTAEASARCGQDPGDGRHWTVSSTFKRSASPSKGLGGGESGRRNSSQEVSPGGKTRCGSHKCRHKERNRQNWDSSAS